MNECFIHFGCWNNGGCSSNKSQWTFVKQALQEDILASKPEFITVCGDNYYPSKTKTDKSSIKTYDKGKMEEGFACLPKNVPIYMNYGNHDYETNLMVKETSTQETTCELTKDENAVVSRLNETGYNISLKMFQQIPFGQHSLVIMIDTTMYDDDDIGEYLGCYSVVDSNYTQLETIRNTQKTFVETVIRENVNNSQLKNIVLVGHHPILQYKYKKNSIKTLGLNNDMFSLLYDTIYSGLNDTTQNS